MSKQPLKTFPVLDLVSALLVGFHIGFVRQRCADSGGIYPRQIIISMAIAGSAYLFGYLFTYKIGLKTVFRIPLWVQVAVRGSFFCALLLNCIYYIAFNWDHIQKYSSLCGELFERLINLLIVTTGYSIFALFIMGIMHLINYGINRLRSYPSVLT